jgi:predicted RecB family endonuclease
MTQNEEEQLQLERRLAEQSLLRQALTERNERLAELEAEVTYLRRTLNDVLAAPRPQPAYAPAVRKTAVPRRWLTAA